MALGIAPDQVLLADAATGREIVRLTTLQPVRPMPLAFSPDGTKLVAGNRAEDRTDLGSAANPRPARPAWGWIGTPDAIPPSTASAPVPLPA